MTNVIDFPAEDCRPRPLTWETVIEREMLFLDGLKDSIHGAPSEESLSALYAESNQSLQCWMAQLRVERDPRIIPVLILQAYHNALAMIAVAAEQTARHPGAA